MKSPVQPFLAPSGHLIICKIFPDASFFQPRFFFRHLERRVQRMRHAAISVGLAIVDEVEIDVVGVGGEDISKQLAAIISPAHRIKPQRHAPAQQSIRSVGCGTLRPMAAGKIGRVNAQQMNNGLNVIATAAYGDRIAIKCACDCHGLPVESLQITPGIPERSCVIEGDGDNKQRE